MIASEVASDEDDQNEMVNRLEELFQAVSGLENIVNEFVPFCEDCETHGCGSLCVCGQMYYHNHNTPCRECAR